MRKSSSPRKRSEPSKADRAREIMNSVADSIAELEKKIDSPETQHTIRAWLKSLARFHHYSFRNTFWLQHQARLRNFQLEQVASFAAWTAMSGADGQKVQVNKGSKGFQILFPIEQIEYQRDEQGQPLLDRQGEKIPELDEHGNVKKNTWFGIGYVFDVKQTNAREIGAYQEPDFYGRKVEISSALVDEIAARIRQKYLPVNFISDPGDRADGFYVPKQHQIFINTVNVKEPYQQLGTLFHELGHAIMHNLQMEKTSTHQKEGQAEAFAYAASIPFGIELSSELYIKSWIEDKVPLADVLKNIAEHVKNAYEKLGLAELAAAYHENKRLATEPTHPDAARESAPAVMPPRETAPTLFEQLELGF